VLDAFTVTPQACGTARAARATAHVVEGNRAARISADRCAGRCTHKLDIAETRLHRRDNFMFAQLMRLDALLLGLAPRTAGRQLRADGPRRGDPRSPHWQGASRLAAAAPGFVEPFTIAGACERMAELDLDDGWSPPHLPYVPPAHPQDEPLVPPADGGSGDRGGGTARRRRRGGRGSGCNRPKPSRRRTRRAARRGGHGGAGQRRPGRTLAARPADPRRPLRVPAPGVPAGGMAAPAVWCTTRRAPSRRRPACPRSAT